MSRRSNYSLVLCILLGTLACVVYADFKEEPITPASDSDESSSEEEESEENLSDLEEIRRKRRFIAGEDEVAQDERTVGENIAAIRQIVEFLEAVGQRVIPLIMQGAAAINKLLSSVNPATTVEDADAL